MRLAIQSIFLVLVLASFTFGQATNEKTTASDVEPRLNENLKTLQPFVGTWVIDGKWSSGQPIWAKNVYTVGMDGNYLEARTYTKNPDGKVYQRYLTIWRWDKEKAKVVSHGFTHDGAYAELEPTVEMKDGKSTVTSVWTPEGAPAPIKQTVQMLDEKSYSWKVWSVVSGKENEMMDGVWNRQ